MHETIIQNILTLLRYGAFPSEKSPVDLVAMSPYKWRKLVSAAEKLEILPYIANAVSLLEGKTDLPASLTECIRQYPVESLQIKDYDTSTAKLYNFLTQKRLEEVHEEELNSDSLSEETLILLDIIVMNADNIITKDVNINGIVSLGRYVRMNEEKVDFEKLKHWLAIIGLVQMATLQGNMLSECMGFTKEELPFIRKRKKKAKQLFIDTIEKVFCEHSISNTTRLNVAMLETVSHRITSAVSFIKDIEE